MLDGEKMKKMEKNQVVKVNEAVMDSDWHRKVELEIEGGVEEY